MIARFVESGAESAALEPPESLGWAVSHGSDIRSDAPAADRGDPGTLQGASAR